MPVKVCTIRFISAYHVGWRRPEEIVDHFTLLRALMSLAYTIGARDLALALRSGAVKASALLPVVKGRDELKILAPLPPIPARVKPSKLGLKWITLNALLKLIGFANECAERSGCPILIDADSRSVIVECTADGRRLRLSRRASVVKLEEEEVLSEPHVEPVVEYHNRVDRVTGSADLYPLTGYRSLTGYAVILKAEDDVIASVQSLLRLLEVAGLGAYRSRGWGRVRVEAEGVEEALPSDVKLLSDAVKWVGEGYYVLLGAHVVGEFMDRSRSFVRPRVVEGRAGPCHAEYKLPMIVAADVGSMVYLRSEPGPFSYEVDCGMGEYKPILIFNPVFVGGA